MQCDSSNRRRLMSAVKLTKMCRKCTNLIRIFIPVTPVRARAGGERTWGRTQNHLKLAYHTFWIGTRYHYGMTASRRLAGVFQTAVFHDIDESIVVLGNVRFIGKAFAIKRVHPATSGGRPRNRTGWAITFLGNVICPKLCGFIAHQRMIGIRIWFGLCTCFVFQTNVMLVKILI